MRHLLLSCAAATAALVLFASPASAHAGLTPGELPPGATADAELVLVHGCGPGGTIPDDEDEAFPTTAVTLRPPAGLTVTAHPVAGWRLETESGPDGRLQTARWESVDPAGTLDPIFLGVEVTVDELPSGTELWLPVEQDCTGSERLTWTHEGIAHGDGDGGEHFPAMRLVVDASAVVPGQAGPAGVSPVLVVGLAVALAAVAGGVVFAVSGRR